MAETDDTKAVLQPEGSDMSKALSMAADIFASAQQTEVPSSQPTGREPQPTEPMSNEELAAALAGMLASKENSPDARADAPPPAPVSPPQTGGPDGSGLGSIASVLPTLMQAFSGNGNFIKPEKLNLIKAFKPYMTAEHGGDIDRAIRMANIARAAKSALSALGR